VTLAELVPLVLKVSLAALVFTMGLGTGPGAVTALLRRPGKLLRALVSMNLAMLVVATVIVKLFALARPVEIILVALALSPVPPLLPKKLVKAGGGHDYVMALFATASVFAILWIPLVGPVIDWMSPADISIPPWPVAKLVAMTLLGPTLAGALVRLFLPRFAERVAGPLSHAATLLLFAAVGMVIFMVGPAMLALLGDGTLLAIVAFLVLGLIAGHLLGGRAPGDRSVLALITASRHPGVAIAVAHLVFPQEKAVIPAVLIYLLADVVISLPYVAWRKKALAAPAPAGLEAAVRR
jgi:BASS family bile acid:Na+ symporter